MVANTKSRITIPFGSLRERAGGFKCCTDHFLTFYDTVLCKSNANDNRRISRFVLAISR